MSNPHKTETMKVSFQGEIGAYSESAIYSFFDSDVEAKPCKSMTDVFESVKNEETSYGVVPIENSIEGSVNQTYDLFLTYDLNVCGEIILKIDHCLIANPGTHLRSVTKVYSHPQALAQCRKFLELRGWRLISTFDTAGSVRMIKEELLVNACAVASERAAEIYGMKILATKIGDTPHNFTRFFVLAKHDSRQSVEDKTSIIFSVKSVPGALFTILKEFAMREINLTKIESRPTKQTPWEYNFYLDFEGHRNETRCREALESIKEKTLFVKILGSYQSASEEPKFNF